MIWTTNAAIHRERLRLPHHHKRRFLTRQVSLASVLINTFIQNKGSTLAFHLPNQKESIQMGKGDGASIF